MTEPKTQPLPPMNGTLHKLYDLASLPAIEMRKPAIMASAVKEMALILVYIYTELTNTSQQITEMLKMVSAISNRTHQARKEDTPPPDKFTKVVNYFTDKILPYFIIGFIYLLIQIMVEKANK